MVSWEVHSLARKLGVSLSDRSVTHYYFWDGKDLGTNYNDTDDDGNTLPRLLPLPDHQVVHDIAHWVVATPWLRDLPEWGLWQVYFQYGADAGWHRKYEREAIPHKVGSKALTRAFDAYMSGLVEPEEADRQEKLAEMLGHQFQLEMGLYIPREARYDDQTPHRYGPATISKVCGTLEHMGFDMSLMRALAQRRVEEDVWAQPGYPVEPNWNPGRVLGA